jgi:hypothetical protein
MILKPVQRYSGGDITLSKAQPNFIINASSTNTAGIIKYQDDGSNHWAVGISSGAGDKNYAIYNFVTSSRALSVDVSTNRTTLSNPGGSSTNYTPLLLANTATGEVYMEQAIQMGSGMGQNYSSRIVQYNNRASHYGSGLKFQVHSSSSAASWTTALDIVYDGAATFVNSVTATAFFESSDLTQKTVLNRFPSTDGIDAIDYTFNPTGQRKYGYGAQEVAEVIPSAVITGDDGKLKVDYNSVHTYKIAMLEQEIREMRAEIAKLKNR